MGNTNVGSNDYLWRNQRRLKMREEEMNVYHIEFSKLMICSSLALSSSNNRYDPEVIKVILSLSISFFSVFIILLFTCY